MHRYIGRLPVLSRLAALCSTTVLTDLLQAPDTTFDESYVKDAI